METDAVLDALASTPEGLSGREAARRLEQVGPNALVSHGARPLTILLNQFRNPLLILLIGYDVSEMTIPAFGGSRSRDSLHRRVRHSGV